MKNCFWVPLLLLWFVRCFWQQEILKNEERTDYSFSESQRSNELIINDEQLTTKNKWLIKAYCQQTIRFCATLALLDKVNNTAEENICRMYEKLRVTICCKQTHMLFKFHSIAFGLAFFNLSLISFSLIFTYAFNANCLLSNIIYVSQAIVVIEGKQKQTICITFC